MSRITDILRLIRLINCILAWLAVYIGADLTWLLPGYYPALFSGLAAFLVCAGGNIINDIRDIDTDRINRPQRVLVQGRVSVKTAWWLYGGLNLAALFVAWSVSQPVLVCVVIAIALLAAYSIWLKRVVVVGNLTIAFLAGLTFMTGGLAIDPKLATVLPGPIIPALFAFFFHLVREILKDVEDIEGDRRTGLVTLPQVIGATHALGLCLGLFFLLTLLTYLPVFKSWYGQSYEIIVVYLIDLPLLALLIFTWGNPNRKLLRISSWGLKLGMLLGLVALMIG